jgi:tRNA 2-selenouridine synthase
MFESLVWSALHGFDPAQPVFVEAESKKIGNLRVPPTLITGMWESACVNLDAPIDLRIEMLIEEYRHFVTDPAALGTQLDCLVAHYGQQQIAAWKELAGSGGWDALVRELLDMHYDPAYTRSTLKHYPQLAQGIALAVPANSDAAFERVAAQCLAAVLKPSNARLPPG